MYAAITGLANDKVMDTERSEATMESDEDVCGSLCKLCKGTLRKPVQSACSGFRYCEVCAESLRNGYEANMCCPFCKDSKSFEIHKVFRDRAAEKDLLASSTPVQGRAWREQNHKALEGTLASPKGSAVVETGPVAGGVMEVGGSKAQGTEILSVGGAKEGSPMQSQIASMQEKMLIYEGVITVLCREVEKLTMQMETMERQRRQEREQLDAMDRKVKALERKVALKNVTISELNLRITALEQTSYEGTLLWKITDFDRKRQEAISGMQTSIYSPPFYTSKEGYKMCARLYLNGDEDVEGTHISLLFVIMRGQYDALLKWPFRQKVTLMFLDQSGKDLHVMDAFRPDPTSSSFKRPTTEMNIASGCPLFMSLTQLDSSLHLFVKDDTAFMRISVSQDTLS